MPWQNIRIEDYPGDASLKRILVDFTDDAEFKDSPLTVDIVAKLDDHADIRRQCEQMVASARLSIQAERDETGILAMLNAETE